MPYSRQIPEAAWEVHREFVLSRYIGDNLSLKKVRDELALRRGFEVTLSQLEYRCKTKWELHKNLNKASWQHIGTLRARDGGGERQFFNRGMHIPPRKVAKEIKRHGPLHKEILARPLVTGPANGPGTLTAGLSLDFPGLRSCPVAFDSDLPVVKIGTVSAEEQGHLAAIGALRPSERLQLLSKIIKRLVGDYHDETRRINPRRLPNLINALASVISISKVDSKELSASGTVPVAFRTAILELWNTFFPWENLRLGWFSKSNSTCWLDDDEKFHRIVTWLLAASGNPSRHRRTIDDAFDQALIFGYVKVALLLLPSRNFSISPHFVLEDRGIQEIARLRTESSLLLTRRIVLNGSPKWRRFVVSNLVKYSRTEDLKELLASASAIFELGKRWNDTWSWPHDIRGILIDCVTSETEDSATKKLEIFMDEFEKMGVVLNATHVARDVFITAARRGYLRVITKVLTINQDLLIADDRGFTALHAAADFGHLEMCKWILQRNPESQKDIDGLLSAMFVAIAQGHFEIVQLFDSQLSVIHRRQLSAAEWRVLLCPYNHTATTASSQERIGKIPFTIGNVEFKLTTSNSTCILCGAAVAASIEGRTSQLQFYLAHGATVSLHPTLSATIIPDKAAKCCIPSNLTSTSATYLTTCRTITIGSLSARMSCVALLMDSGITPTARDKITSLRAGEWEMTQLLDFYGVPIQHDQSRFEAAICGRDQHCITEIYKTGNLGFDAGALCAAVAFAGDSQFIGKLALGILARRVASDLGSPVESTAIAMAALQDDMELFMKLLSAIPSPHPSCTIFSHMFSSSDTRTGTKALKAIQHAILQRSFQGEVNIWDNPRNSLLGVVAICGRPEMLQALFDRGIQRDLEACSMAMKVGCLRSLEVLLRGQPPLRTWARSHGTDADKPPFAAIRHWNDSKCDFSPISQILSAGADINDATTDTLICLAAESKNIRLVEFLIQNGADVNARSLNYSTTTALYRALTIGGADLVQLLLDHGADVNAPQPEDFDTCLQRAARRFRFLEMLIDKKVQVDGDHRLDFIIAVFRSQPLGAARLRQYGSWQDEDEDILKIIKSLKFLQTFPRRIIKEGISRELAKRQQVKMQVPEMSDTTGNMTSTDDPRSLGILSPDDSRSEWQFGPGYFRDTNSFAEFHHWSYPFIDMSTPPYSWEGMEICDQDYGPNLMCQRIGYVYADEEDEPVRLD